LTTSLLRGEKLRLFNEKLKKSEFSHPIRPHKMDVLKVFPIKVVFLYIKGEKLAGSLGE
jgi:hypothetical protein